MNRRGSFPREIAPGTGRSSSLPACSKFTCPMPPSVNAAYKNAKRGRVKTEAYKTWEKMAAVDLKRQKIEPVKGYCAIVYGFERKSKLADVSNRLKLMEDMLVKMNVIEDDRFVTATALSWLPWVSGLAHIEIHPLSRLTVALMPADDGSTAAWVPLETGEENEKRIQEQSRPTPS